ncbi:hypothetical protein QKW60_08595 [Defluviimonas aestuarii]|uniref:hypothetical protein n=1 Tax=Albidovulum aestuarii TaxID=1130726 RepID=UPI00249CE017|nr:hypothetical protein [Defluviimonas aestuarii]MDI3336461.1 hypothetical protein [Defluviimonas aestuarii]
MARLRTLAEWEALTGKDKLTDPEKELIECCREGRECKLGDGTRPEGPDPDRNIRADLLRYLILGGCDECMLDEVGVQLIGAYVPDHLILDFGSAVGQTRLVNVCFAEEISAQQTLFKLLNLSGSQIPGLNAQCAVFEGPVFLRDKFCAIGEVNFAGARIESQLDCSNARFENAHGKALNAQVANVAGGVFLQRGFKAIGEVRLSGLTVGGQFSCLNSSFNNANGYALEAGRITVGGEFLWKTAVVEAGIVHLAAAHVGVLVDDLQSWPESGRLYLDGFTYDRIGASTTDADSRLEWLGKGDRWNGDFYPQPYTQLAKVLREMGHDHAARKVMIRKEELLAKEQLKVDRARLDRLRNGTPTERGDTGFYWLRMHFFRIWIFLIRWLVGYGYSPQLALYWAVGTMTFMTVFYFILWHAGGFVPNSALIMNSTDWAAAMAISPTAPGPVWAATAPSGAHYETFWAGFYAADVFIPLINFGQEAAWTATTQNVAGWFAFLATFAFKGFGWFITALGAAAIGGIIRRE